MITSCKLETVINRNKLLILVLYIFSYIFKYLLRKYNYFKRYYIIIILYILNQIKKNSILKKILLIN